MDRRPLPPPLNREDRVPDGPPANPGAIPTPASPPEGSPAGTDGRTTGEFDIPGLIGWEGSASTKQVTVDPVLDLDLEEIGLKWPEPGKAKAEPETARDPLGRHTQKAEANRLASARPERKDPKKDKRRRQPGAEAFVVGAEARRRRMPIILAALTAMLLLGAAVVGFDQLRDRGFEAAIDPASPSIADLGSGADSGSADTASQEQPTSSLGPEIVDLEEFPEEDTLRLEIPLQPSAEAESGIEVDVDPTLEPLQLIIADGKISLIGAVRTEEQAQAMADRAAEVFPDADLVSDYEVNPRAPKPSTGVVVQKPVVFEPGSAEIRDEFKPILDACADVMAFNPTLVMTVTGHTDDIGSDEYNLELAERRAQAVVDYYIESGLDREQFDRVSLGENAPLAPNDSDEGRQDNRRTDLEFEGIFDDVVDVSE